MAVKKNTIHATGLITPGDERNTFPIFDPTYELGGFRQVENKAEMLAIPFLRRRKGMFVALPAMDEMDSPIVNENNYQVYELWYLVNNPITAGTTITDWQIFAPEGTAPPPPPAEEVDFIFFEEDNNGVTEPTVTPTMTTLAFYENGWIWKWKEDSGWVVLGQLEMPIPVGFDYVFFEENNDGLTEPGITPSIPTLAIYQNGWFWEWDEINEWVVLGKIDFQFTQVQSDWNETNVDSPAYIKNKPTIASVDTYINLTDTPATYTPKALPSTNAAGDALIWSKVYYDPTADETSVNSNGMSGAVLNIQGKNTVDSKSLKIQNSTLKEVFFIADEGLVRINTRDGGTGNDFLAMANAAGGVVGRISRADTGNQAWLKFPVLSNLTTEQLLIFATSNSVRITRIQAISTSQNATNHAAFSTSTNFHLGSSTFKAYNLELTARFSNNVPNANSVREMWVSSNRAGSVNGTITSTTAFTILHGLGGEYIYLLLQGASDTPNVTVFFVGNRHVIQNIYRYADRETIIVNEIKNESSHGEFGFYAHKSNGGIFKQPLPTFADNDAAIAGGLTIDMWYKTAAGDVKIVV